MPKNTEFCSKWLHKLDNTGRVCSRWLKKGKITSSFQCIVCRTDDFNCANGGWADIKMVPVQFADKNLKSKKWEIVENIVSKNFQSYDFF